MWVNTLKNKHMPMKAKRAIIQQCIKPCITYGMELWAPPSQNYYDKLDKPIKWAIKTALHIKHHERRAFPVVLLHNDLAIRPMTSENKAAHIKHAHRLQHRDPDSTSHNAHTLSH